ncbi:MAG: hypothetical protein KA954_08845 [Chitinophagales bacterium]|nr:hypothetical protein [Bacteroidota bacterium]MBP7399679.1 hypothetical protein [Chitinophagales bacterium]MBK8486462.1 hypothetical protein [Bacteroidota bacterium]MBK8683242.1 hypothetical protein [Bacteroidota bacterium]MBP8754249.1 hypothetical protein [Chitinophagales bacterium]
MESLMTNIVLPAGVILIAICTILFVFSLFAGIFQNLKGSLKLLIGVGIILVIFFISFAMASDVNPAAIDVSGGTVKFVTAGIITMAVLIIVAVVTAIGTAIVDAFK